MRILDRTTEAPAAEDALGKGDRRSAAPDESQGSAVGRKLEGFRAYLLSRARRQVVPHLRGKVDLSGAVQLTLLEAHHARERLRTENPHELAGWLRKALRDNLTDMVRWSCAAKRDVRRERSFCPSSEASSAQWGAALTADQSSPSGRIQHQEKLLAVYRALLQLPEDQRQVLQLHYLEGLTLKQLAQRLDRSSESVAGLLYRGMKTLRSRMQAEG